MMLSVASSFAGCTGKRKAMAVGMPGETLLYISSSNIVAVDSCGRNVTFMDHNLSCMDSAGEKVVCGDDQGFGHIIVSGSRFTTKCGGKVQDCCILGDTAIFSTLDTIVVFIYRESRTFTHSLGFVVSCISAVQDHILVGSISGDLYVYVLSADQDAVVFLERVDAHTDSITDIRASQDGIVATCSQDSNVKVWMVGPSITLFQTLNGHSDWVNGAAWDGSTLHTASSDKTVRTWKQNGTDVFYVCSDIIGGASEFLGVLVLRNELLGHLKTGGIDKLHTNRCLVSGHLDGVSDVDWRGDLLMSCSLDRTTRIFSKGRECGRPQTHGYPLSSSKFLPGSRLRLISSGHETILRIYEATQSFFLSSQLGDSHDFGPLEEYRKCAHPAELNLTNETGECCSKEPLSEGLLSTSVFREVKKIYGHYFEIKNIAVGRSLILTCNRSAAKNFSGVFLWSLEGEKLQYAANHDLGIQRIAISPDETLAMTVSRDKTSCLYLIRDARLVLLKRFADHKRAVWDCGFSRDSRYAATCSRDGQVVLYDTGLMSIKVSRMFSSEIISLDFSPRDNLLAVGTDTGIIKVMNYDLKIVEESRVVGKRLNVLRFSEDGRRIAVGGSDGLLRVIALHNT